MNNPAVQLVVKPRISTNAEASVVNADNRSADDSSRWVCFNLAGQVYGLGILRVQEVLADAEIEPVPGAAAQILGVSNLRGSIVTILDLRCRLGLPPQPTPAPVCVIVVDSQGEPVGLRVDHVVDVRSIRDNVVKSPPATGGTASGVLGVVACNGAALTLLDVDSLVAPLLAASAQAA